MKVESSDFADELDVGWKKKGEIKENFDLSHNSYWDAIRGLEKTLGEAGLRGNNRRLVWDLSHLWWLLDLHIE